MSGASSDAKLVDLWLRTGKRKSLATRKAYLADAEAFLGAVAPKQLSELRAVDVQDWADSLPGAPSTRARRISAIRSLFMFAYKTGYLRVNVAVVVEPPQVPNELAERILPEERLWPMLRTVSGRCGLMVRVLYASGGRVDEICKLQWKHVQQQPEGTARLTIHGKGQKTRWVLVLASVAAELEAQRGDDEQFVFATRSGRAPHPTWALKCVRRAARMAGIRKNVSPHWLRHAYGSHALDRGASIKTVQESLGHSSIATTGKYLHVKPKDSAGLYLKGFDSE